MLGTQGIFQKKFLFSIASRESNSHGYVDIDSFGSFVFPSVHRKPETHTGGKKRKKEGND